MLRSRRQDRQELGMAMAMAMAMVEGLRSWGGWR